MCVLAALYQLVRHEKNRRDVKWLRLLIPGASTAWLQSEQMAAVQEGRRLPRPRCSKDKELEVKEK